MNTLKAWEVSCFCISPTLLVVGLVASTSGVVTDGEAAKECIWE